MDKKKIISNERKKYLRKIKIRKFEILSTQIFIVIVFIALWEILARKGIIDSFIASQPSRIVKTFMNLSSNNLLEHLKITCEETLIGFGLGSIAGVIIAIILLATRLYDVIIGILIILAGALVGNYVQQNKDDVKAKLKKFIDRM